MTVSLNPLADRLSRPGPPSYDPPFMIAELPRIPPAVELRSGASAARRLARSLGRRRAAAILAEVGAAQLRRQPFAHLDRPADRREALSRRQCAPAILLFRALRKRLGEARALELTGEIVLDGTVHFLRYAIGPLHRHELMRLEPAEREAFVRRLGERFFNATIRWDEIGAERLRMTVTRCLFPVLCRLGGAPQVARLLCHGDAVYFGEVLGTVELIRPYTQAEGARDCPFELRWK